jgi:ketosteroid isomerase-like protein
MSEVIASLTAALNAHDVEAAAALMHEDYRSEQPAHPGRSFVGRAQMHANWQAMLAGIPDFHAELIRSIDDGDMTWCEWSWSGKRGDGQEIQVRGVTLFEIRNGMIVAGRLYMEDVESATSIEEDVENMSGQRPDDLSGSGESGSPPA